jgi:arylsulfatase/uncharacterized sulfatase
MTASIAEANNSGDDQRPNVVMILVDDAGLTDFAPFGGEARMPHIQTLADRGTKFSNYHSSPLCAPSRAMLLTGIDNHRTGIATIAEVLTDNQAGQPGYSMFLEPGVTTLAERLKTAGYNTYMTGKWHLGSREQDLPNGHGFDRSFALDASGADNWEQKPYMGYYDFAPWYEDGKAANLPEDFYSSKFIVDRMISYLDSYLNRNQQPRPRQPFFSYLAFQAIHIPVQAPREITDSYNGVYDQGWHRLRERRRQRAIELGLIPADAPLAAMPADSKDWLSLSPEDRALYARSMQVQAAMLESMDSHIGRFIAYLKARGELDNTLFILTSDNGPEPSDPLAVSGMQTWMKFNGYNRRLDNLGERGSMVAIGSEWASASASPLNMFKFYAAEGGIRVPLIIAGPKIAEQRWQSAITMVTDIAPTVLDYLNISQQQAGAVAITGRSMMPLLEGSASAIYAEDDVIGMEVSGNSALIKGDYKLSRNSPPHGDNIWRLYNLALDPGESNDLRALQAERFDQLMEDYRAYESEFGVIAPAAGFDYMAQTRRNSVKKLLHSHWQRLALGAVLVLFFAMLIRSVYRRRQA